MSTNLKFQSYDDQVGLTGSASFTVIRGRRPGPMRPQTTMDLLRRALREGLPTTAASREVNRWRVRNLRHLHGGMRRLLLASTCKLPTFVGALWLTPIYADGRRVDLGLVSLDRVVSAGVNFIVDAFQNLVELEIMKYHGLGTGSATEVDGDTALGTELTTQYNPDNTRATGNLAEGASSNIFHTEATNTLDVAPGSALREWGVFTQAATGGGTMLDRVVYSAITLNAGDGLLSKFELTLSPGG